ncbi:MAG: hypothetical protein R6U40_03240 [Desulfobacterales bacterium]
MKTFKSSGAFRPFKELKVLLEKKSLHSAPPPVVHAKKQVLKTRNSQYGLSDPDKNILDVKNQGCPMAYSRTLAEVGHRLFKCKIL